MCDGSRFPLWSGLLGHQMLLPPLTGCLTTLFKLWCITLTTAIHSIKVVGLRCLKEVIPTSTTGKLQRPCWWIAMTHPCSSLPVLSLQQWLADDPALNQKWSSKKPAFCCEWSHENRKICKESKHLYPLVPCDIYLPGTWLESLVQVSSTFQVSLSWESQVTGCVKSRNLLR